MKTRQIVHDILCTFPKTRDCDKELLLKYYLNYSETIYAKDFIEEHFEFINNYKRERAYLQNTRGMFVSTSPVIRARRKKEERIVEAIREEKKSFASNIYNYAKRIIRNK